VQALYQWQITGQDPRDVYSQFATDAEAPRRDEELFRRLVLEIPQQAEDLDALIDELADRPVSQIDPVEHGILLVGVYELRQSPEIPFRVIINEAVELSRQYGAEEGHRYVNALLDKAARRVREAEIGAGT
jgi:N utilization substance protein B